MIKLFDDENEMVVDYQMYSDGTPMVKLQLGFEPHSILIQPVNLMEFFVGMMIVDVPWLNIKYCVLPYLPGARQDRSNPDGDVLNTLFSVGEMLELRFADFSGSGRVLVIDPHSEEAEVRVKSLAEYPLENVASQIWPGYSGIIAPDAGAVARAEKFAHVMGLPCYYGNKVRDVSNGKLSGFSIDLPPGGHYLVVDDICDGGGTFVGLGEEIKRNNAFADLYVTHGIFSKGTSELKKYYKNIYTTDSRQHRDDAEVYVIKVVEDMMDQVREAVGNLEN